MGLAERLEQLVPATPADESKDAANKVSQFKDLEKAEAALKSVGVSLEPKFNISLAARIGMTTATKKGI